VNKQQFWTAIDRAKKEGGGWHGMYEPLQAGLSGLDVTDIITWYLIFEKYRALRRASSLLCNKLSLEKEFPIGQSRVAVLNLDVGEAE